MMTAVVQAEYGPDPRAVLGTGAVPVPRAGEHDVLVQVRAASVDRGTWHLMTGVPYPIRLVTGVRRPTFGNPGRSVAGIVHAVGAGVAGLAPGDRVYGTCDGSFAEY